MNNIISLMFLICFMNINAIKSRMNAIKSIGKIFSAMKSISIAKMRSCQNDLERFFLYFEALISVYFKVISINSNNDLISLRKVFDNICHNVDMDKVGNNKTNRKNVLIVFSANNGLCGSFFSNCLKKMKTIDLSKYDDIFVFGDKMSSLRFLKNNIRQINELDEIIKYVMQCQANVTLIYTQFFSIYSRILMEDRIDIYAIKKHAMSLSSSKDYYNDISEVCMNELIDQLILGYIRYAHLTNSVSEHASIFFVTDKASNNANDLEKENLIKYNKARQSKITMELLDIVAGSSV